DGGMPAAASSSLPPTEIEMVNRRIRLTTGQATITLDGPDIRIEADRDITLLANQTIKLKSTGGSIDLLGGPMVNLNPPGADGDRPHAKRQGYGEVVIDGPALATRRPSDARRAQLSAALSEQDYARSIPVALDAFGIDVAPVASLAFDPTLAQAGTVDIDGVARVGQPAMDSPASLGSTLVHVATQAKLAAALRNAGYGSWPEGTEGSADTLHAVDAMAYQAELDSAPNTGLDEGSQQFVQHQLEQTRAGMTDPGRTALDEQRLPT
ncbi:MAG: hypothetical protein AAGA56_18415, partial [Myxococcota bacterium]